MALCRLLLLIVSSVDARVTLTHSYSSHDPSGNFQLRAMKAAFSKAFGPLLLRLESDEHTTDARVSGDIPLPESSPIKLAFVLAHKPHLKQAALRLIANSCGATLVAATPFVPGGPPALLNVAPSLITIGIERELHASGMQVDLSVECDFKDQSTTMSVNLPLRDGRAAVQEMITLGPQQSIELATSFMIALAKGRTLRVDGSSSAVLAEVRGNTCVR